MAWHFGVSRTLWETRRDEAILSAARHCGGGSRCEYRCILFL
ncbi:hypothetical protein CSPAE12_05229 [Colletotrichum incanum]|nr:hypothetical protein CSPAE12_05229 [Colletotrichum incanum]